MNSQTGTDSTPRMSASGLKAEILHLSREVARVPILLQNSD